MTTQPTQGVIPEWTLGDRLRKARGLTGLTTREFAEEIGVSQKTVTSAENDAHNVRKILLFAWSNRTGVPLEWLLTGELTTPGGPGGGERVIPLLARSAKGRSRHDRTGVSNPHARKLAA